MSNSQRPVQLIIAGKAHPADQAGQDLIQKWVRFIRQPEVRPHAIFLSDYDMLLTEHLVQGVDVWINTPRRPWEACGTSGMKVLVNGGINLSELDGWWAEAYTPEVGWALGDGQEHGDDPAWDAAEAEALYSLLEREVIPEFYTRDANGIPVAWVARMRESMARLTPRFSANRAVCEYAEKHYIPAAAAYRVRAADKGAVGKQVVDWQQALETRWSGLRLGKVTVKTDQEHHAFEVEVITGELDPSSVRVELYADGVGGGAPVLQEMKRCRESEAAGLRLRCASARGARICRLYSASRTAFLRCCGSAGSPSNPMAASVTKAAERPLHDYLEAVSDQTDVRAGSALPLGTSQQENGVNFSFFSRHATRVRLELFDRPQDRTPSRHIDLDPARNRTGDVWHVWVDGIRPGQLYALSRGRLLPALRRATVQFREAPAGPVCHGNLTTGQLGFRQGSWI